MCAEWDWLDAQGEMTEPIEWCEDEIEDGPNELDLLQDGNECPSGVVLQACLLFLGSCLARFKESGKSEDAAILALDSWLNDSPQEQIQQAWQRAGDEFVRLLGTEPQNPAQLIRNAQPRHRQAA